MKDSTKEIVDKYIDITIGSIKLVVFKYCGENTMKELHLKFQNS